MYEFINTQKAKATKDSANFVMKTFRRYVAGAPALVSPPCLNRQMSKFFMKVTKLKGEEYEQDSLTAYHRGIQRFFDGKRFNILTDPEFAELREMLTAKRTKLKNRVWVTN